MSIEDSKVDDSLCTFVGTENRRHLDSLYITLVFLILRLGVFRVPLSDWGTIEYSDRVALVRFLAACEVYHDLLHCTAV